MMMTRRLIHPRMITQLRDTFYDQICTIRTASTSRDAIGGEINSWSDLAGHNSLDCHVSPASGGERRTVNQVYLDATHEIGLAGYSPAITEQMHAVIENVAYDILLVRHDSQKTTTTLVARLVR
jgi:hypothetical protein